MYVYGIRFLRAYTQHLTVLVDCIYCILAHEGKRY